jgi:hypothetical protein
VKAFIGAPAFIRGSGTTSIVVFTEARPIPRDLPVPEYRFAAMRDIILRDFPKPTVETLELVAD